MKRLYPEAGQKNRRRNSKPVIGITCEVVKLKPFFSEYDLACDFRYVRAILRAGGLPLLLPISYFKRDVPLLLDQIDGLLIPGGTDIPPSFYGENSSKKILPVFRGRTYFEIRLYRAARKKKIPTLAICYGMQLVNVIHGGTLFQDIPTQIKGAHNHRDKKNPVHRVELLRGSVCQKIFKKNILHVHSEHHQAVKSLGRGLKMSAFSEDGIVEAIEGPDSMIAVQWHPERQPKDPAQSKLFRYFIRLARKRSLSR